MARRAADALGHVNTVVEVDEVGQIVHALPLERPVFTETGADRLRNQRCSRSGSGNSCRSWWGDVGKPRLDHGRMAITAVDPHRPDVVRVAELDGLIPDHALAADIPRPRDGDHVQAEAPTKSRPQRCLTWTRCWCCGGRSDSCLNVWFISRLSKAQPISVRSFVQEPSGVEPIM